MLPSTKYMRKLTSRRSEAWLLYSRSPPTEESKSGKQEAR